MKKLLKRGILPLLIGCMFMGALMLPGCKKEKKDNTGAVLLLLGVLNSANSGSGYLIRIPDGIAK